MGDAYRDDLAAALLRAEDLDRENAQLRARNAELERRFAPPRPLDEAERNRARLLEAVTREREEAAARARAREDEARLRALARSSRSHGDSDEQRSIVLTLALVGVILAGAMGSAAGIAIVIGVAGAALAFVDPRGDKR